MHAHGPASALKAAPALMFTNSEQEPICPERPHSCTGWCKELIIKVTNDYPGFIAFSGIICMNFASLVNNPSTVINKTELVDNVFGLLKSDMFLLHVSFNCLKIIPRFNFLKY